MRSKAVKYSKTFNDTFSHRMYKDENDVSWEGKELIDFLTDYLEQVTDPYMQRILGKLISDSDVEPVDISRILDLRGNLNLEELAVNKMLLDMGAPADTLCTDSDMLRKIKHIDANKDKPCFTSPFEKSFSSDILERFLATGWLSEKQKVQVERLYRLAGGR